MVWNACRNGKVLAIPPLTNRRLFIPLVRFSHSPIKYQHVHAVEREYIYIPDHGKRMSAICYLVLYY